MVGKYDHRRGVTMDDIDVKKELPVHLILSTNEYAQPQQAAVIAISGLLL